MASEVDFECLFSATKFLSVLLLMTGNQRTQCGNPKLTWSSFSSEVPACDCSSNTPVTASFIDL